MEDLILGDQYENTVISVAESFNTNGYLCMSIMDEYEVEGMETYLTPDQAAQLRDHLTEALNKLK